MELKLFGKKDGSRIIEATKDGSIAVKAMGYLVIASALIVAGGRNLGWPSNSELFFDYVDRFVMYVGYLLMIVGFFWHEIKTVRSRRFAKIQHRLHSISHAVRDQHSLLDLISSAESFSGKQSEINLGIERILDQFAFSFTMLTGTNCRASIKLIMPIKNTKRINQNIDNFIVVTYARDQVANESERNRDLDRKSSKKDKIVGNTDFLSIFEGDARVFFCNNLPALSNYQNTSWPDLSKRQLSLPQSLFNYFKPVNWKLSYSSTIVWPIQTKFVSSQEESTASILGFLTIDSPSRGVFDEKHDTFFGAAIADMLFPLLRRVQLKGENPHDN